MVENNDILVTDQHSVQCNGKEFPEDHPVIYLQIPEDLKKTICPYCSKTFILKI